MNSITTHVLDTALGRPAAGIPVQLFRIQSGSAPELLGREFTNADGRARALLGVPLTAGEYRLTFAVEAYFASAQRLCFHTTVQIDFRVTNPSEHHHVPLLISPFGYSTYRGS